MLADPGGGAFQGITAAVGGIVAAANVGFAISEEGGQPLLTAIQELQTEIRTALSRAHRLEMQPPLGSTPNASVYKPFLASVASDPTQGAIPVLKKLQTDLNDAHAAIEKSIANSRNTDEGNAVNVTSSGMWV
jgi:hypothetical protein